MARIEDEMSVDGPVANFCYQCGRPLGSGSEKCYYCGARRRSLESMTRRCIFCDQLIRPKAVKCPHCGEFLDGRTGHQRPGDLHVHIDQAVIGSPDQIRAMSQAVNREPVPPENVLDDETTDRKAIIDARPLPVHAPDSKAGLPAPVRHKTPPAAPAPPAPPARPDNAPPSPLCPDCGVDTRPTDGYCFHCGRALLSQTIQAESRRRLSEWLDEYFILTLLFVGVWIWTRASGQAPLWQAAALIAVSAFSFTGLMAGKKTGLRFLCLVLLACAGYTLYTHHWPF